jgi:hypothetical protein
MTTLDGRYHNMELAGYRKGFGGQLVHGQKFRFEVPLKDKQGLHIGYGPGLHEYTFCNPRYGVSTVLVFGPTPVYIRETVATVA